jgi:hypothetical protein
VTHAKHPPPPPKKKERERKYSEKGEKDLFVYSQTDHTKLDRRIDLKQHTDHKYDL